MSVSSRPVFTAPLRRLLAAGNAALVLALTIFAASPAAHAWLHADTGGCRGHAHAPQGIPADADPGCVVVLFAGGVSQPVGPTILTPPALAPQGVLSVTAADRFLVSPRYLHQPERGPPGWV
jgi:hypothetical protein